MLSDGFTKVADGSTFGAKMPRVASNFILTLHYFLPSLEEQKKIEEYIETKIYPIDNALIKAKREIELLKEFKQSIITDAVTGKIKVYNL
jgi:restriction endonuclease S subunit